MTERVTIYRAVVKFTGSKLLEEGDLVVYTDCGDEWNDESTDQELERS